MSTKLRDVLADALSDADALARLGHEHDARLIQGIVANVTRAAEPWLTFLSETDASLFTGWSIYKLRRRFYELESRGFAYREARTRFYCEALLPRRADIRAAHAMGRAAAQESAA